MIYWQQNNTTKDKVKIKVEEFWNTIILKTPLVQ